jgi:hypothetical protein
MRTPISYITLSIARDHPLTGRKKKKKDIKKSRRKK